MNEDGMWEIDTGDFDTEPSEFDMLSWELQKLIADMEKFTAEVKGRYAKATESLKLALTQLDGEL